MGLGFSSKVIYVVSMFKEVRKCWWLSENNMPFIFKTVHYVTEIIQRKLICVGNTCDWGNRKFWISKSCSKCCSDLSANKGLSRFWKFSLLLLLYDLICDNKWLLPWVLNKIMYICSHYSRVFTFTAWFTLNTFIQIHNLRLLSFILRPKVDGTNNDDYSRPFYQKARIKLDLIVAIKQHTVCFPRGRHAAVSSHRGMTAWHRPIMAQARATHRRYGTSCMRMWRHLIVFTHPSTTRASEQPTPSGDPRRRQGTPSG